MASTTHQHEQIEPLLEKFTKSSSTDFVTRTRRAVLPYRRMILIAQACLLLCYVLGLAALCLSAPAEHSLEKRTVINGTSCPKQRKQLNVFMASFFGGMFAADQLYARNWQLAVPKILFFFLGGPITFVATAFVGLNLHFAWWLIDVVMWGVGYYTTHTSWGNPTHGCAVIGW